MAHGNAGIDYGMGKTNIDRKTGIRFGVISQNDVLQQWCDSSESDYGAPSCPKCGNEAKECKFEYAKWEHAKHECGDYVCRSCRYVFGSESAYGDEPLGFTLDDGEYVASCGSDGDIFITSSPYYTRAHFCSPCAPGAAYLMNPTDDGPKAYCFGHDWFDEGEAPYPVYSVATNELVESQTV